MTHETLERATAAGLVVSISDGGLHVDGPRSTVAEWLPKLREHKAALLELLAESAPVNVGHRLSEAEIAGYEDLLRRTRSAVRLSFTDTRPIYIVADNPDPAKRELSVRAVVELARQHQKLSTIFGELSPPTIRFLDDEDGQDDDEDGHEISTRVVA